MGIREVINAAAGSPRQYSTVEKALGTLENLHVAPADVVAGVTRLQTANTTMEAEQASLSLAKARLAAASNPKWSQE